MASFMNMVLFVVISMACLMADGKAENAWEAWRAKKAEKADTATCGAGLGESAQDCASLLQKPGIPLVNKSQPDAPALDTKPHVIGLRRESVPIYRGGKIASFKTSYSGILSLGSPPQDFRVVFDTGSGHIVLPASECQAEACLVPGRRRYNQTASHSAVPINADGSFVHEGELGEQVTIGFGTGEITGEFVRDTVCFGKMQTEDEKEAEIQERARARGAQAASLITGVSLAGPNYEEVAHSSAAEDASASDQVVDYSPMCVEMNVIAAVDMSTQPFKTFHFDGILGLSLEGLTMNKNFSAFDMLVRSGRAPQPQFGVFLTDGENGEQSEVAFGGVDPRRVLEPPTFSSVPMSDMGYWLVRIKAVRIDGEELDMCQDGTCRGVVDTGTSHLGVPAPWNLEFARRLQVDAGDFLDCRLIQAPTIEIELFEGKVLTMHPWSYMRRLPLRDGVTVSSAKGVTLDDHKKEEDAAAAPAAESAADAPAAESTADAPATATAEAEAAAEAPAVAADDQATQASATPEVASSEATPGSSADSGYTDPIILMQDDGKQQAKPDEEEQKAAEKKVEDQTQPATEASTGTAAGENPAPEEEQPVKRNCSPRLMAVKLPEPLGPKLFILGEPLLHRYYTVYDWENKRVGFSLANNHWNNMDPTKISSSKGELPKEVDMLLMQNSVKVVRPKA
ncbi:unnamed protein product [Polarella glacialis]|uniref:Peptidase A1 domain-containing protein n=1 Tax=Polarella glacialis TaxID=89957 RepID=A0A813F5M8_POLGL|nr:unnamed protein product [Polarella glacialis]